MNDEWRSQALRWLSYALGDLAAARATPSEPRFPRIVAFHAQQASEKAMKSLLLLHEIEPPRTHDLVALRELLPDGTRAKRHRLGLDRLSDYASEARYPEDLRSVSPAQAATAVRQAMAVVGDVRADFADRGVATDEVAPQ